MLYVPGIRTASVDIYHYVAFIDEQENKSIRTASVDIYQKNFLI